MSKSRRSFLKGIALGTGGLGLAPLLNQLDIHASGDQRALPKPRQLVQQHPATDRIPPPGLLRPSRPQPARPESERTAG